MPLAKQFIDLSHTIEHGLITYKGLPAPVICDFLSHEQSKKHYAPGTEFQIGKIEMVANTGSQLRSPNGWKRFLTKLRKSPEQPSHVTIDLTAGFVRAISCEFVDPSCPRGKQELKPGHYSTR
jgi:hypothetical protein